MPDFFEDLNAKRRQVIKELGEKLRRTLIAGRIQPSPPVPEPAKRTWEEMKAVQPTRPSFEQRFAEKAPSAVWQPEAVPAWEQKEPLYTPAGLEQRVRPFMESPVGQLPIKALSLPFGIPKVAETMAGIEQRSPGLIEAGLTVPIMTSTGLGTAARGAMQAARYPGVTAVQRAIPRVGQAAREMAVGEVGFARIPGKKPTVPTVSAVAKAPVPEVTAKTPLNLGRTQGNRLLFEEMGVLSPASSQLTISEIVTKLNELQAKLGKIPTSRLGGPQFRKLDNARITLLKVVENESGLSETGLRNVAEGLPPPRVPTALPKAEAVAPAEVAKPTPPLGEAVQAPVEPVVPAIKPSTEIYPIVIPHPSGQGYAVKVRKDSFISGGRGLFGGGDIGRYPTEEAAKTEAKRLGYKIAEVPAAAKAPEVATPQPVVSPKVAPQAVVATGESIAKDLGIKFDGIQQGYKEIPSRMQFTDPKTGSTFYGDTLEQVKTNLTGMREKFAQAKVAKVPPVAPVEAVAPAEAPKPTLPVAEAVQATIAEPVTKPQPVKAPPVKPPIAPPTAPPITPGGGIQQVLSQAKAIVQRDRPGVINRLLDYTPGLKQLQRRLHPSIGMPEHITESWIGKGTAQSTVSNTLRAELIPAVKKLEAAFGKGAVSGEAKNVAKFIGPADQKVPFSGTLYDVMQRPDLYALSNEQKGLLLDIQTGRSTRFNTVKDAYALDIGEFPAKPGGVFLGNVDKSEGALEMVGDLSSAVKRGAAKERFYETGADRWLHDKTFTPVTDVGQLMALRGDETLANMAGQSVWKAGLGGKTRLEVLQETHPALATKMTAFKSRLQKLLGYKQVLKNEQTEAINTFLKSGIEDVDLADLQTALDVKLKPGRYVAKSQAGKDIATVDKEIAGVRAQIAGLRPGWRTANTKPYVFVQEGIYRYFPASEAPIIRHLGETSKSSALRTLDDIRATAFGGDFSPATIQELNAFFLDPVRTSKIIQKTGPRKLLSEAAMAADVRADAEGWALFTRATGINPLGGMKAGEFGVGYVAKIPKVGPVWTRFNDAVYRPTIWTMKKSFDQLVKDGLKLGLSPEQAAAVAGDDVTKLISNYNFRRLGLSQAEAAQYRGVLTSVSFLTQPASLMTDATKGLVKLGVRKTLTPTEAYAVKRVLTLATLTETIAVTSNAAYAASHGQDVKQAIKDSVNPASGYFMSLVLPNGNRIGLGGPFRSLIKATWPKEIPGVPVPLPFAGLYNFARSKMAPGLRIIHDEIRNQDYFGKKIRTGEFPVNVLQGIEYAVEGAVPLTLGTVGQEIRGGKPEQIPSQVASQFAGVNLVPEDRPYMMRLRWKGDFEEFAKIPKDPIKLAAAIKAGTVRYNPTKYRQKNPEVDAKLFITGQVDSVQTTASADAVTKLIEENKIDPETIKGIQRRKDELKRAYKLGVEKISFTPTDLMIANLPLTRELKPEEKAYYTAIKTVAPYFKIKEDLLKQYPRIAAALEEIETLEAKGDLESRRRAQVIESGLGKFDTMVEGLRLRWRFNNPEGNKLLEKHYGLLPLALRRR